MESVLQVKHTFKSAFGNVLSPMNAEEQSLGEGMWAGVPGGTAILQVTSVYCGRCWQQELNS